MSRRPTVTAQHVTEPITERIHCGDSWTTPGVRLEVTFDLHDHAAALTALDRAVADVRAQIEETTDAAPGARCGLLMDNGWICREPRGHRGPHMASPYEPPTEDQP